MAKDVVKEYFIFGKLVAALDTMLLIGIELAKKNDIVSEIVQSQKDFIE